jgi:hypothetical protein
LFAGFRDDRELVQQLKGVLAACLCEAFEQLAGSQQRIENSKAETVCLVKGIGDSTLPEEEEKEEEEEPAQLSGRAARRNELHHATLAGKGGLLLDFASMDNNKNDKEESTTTTTQQRKPAAQWDLEDCRSWLLEASRRIAQQWVKDRTAVQDKSKWPVGPLEELEGSLVEHSIALCEHLEQELQSRTTAKTKNRVVTPRVQDMSKLGIQWQHGHERGSGGKGGVGKSGNSRPTGNNRTAGQVLFLKTAKSLSSILKDPLAGVSFHLELRAVIGKQEEQKRKKLLEEASRQRLQQMQRKPYLQARAQLET